jgi:hypothetical protein
MEEPGRFPGNRLIITAAKGGRRNEMKKKLLSGRNRRLLPGFLIGALLSALLFAACPMGGGDGDGTPYVPPPVVTLNGSWQGGVDGYVITAKTLDYDGGFGDDYNFGGPITKIIKFDDDTGVIVFRYNKTYATDIALQGKYAGVYYDELAANSVKMAIAIDNMTYAAIVADTVFAIDKVFTEDLMDDISYWGAYTK